MNQIDQILENIIKTTSSEILEERVGELPLIAAQIEGKGFSDIANTLSSKSNITRLGDGHFGVAFSGKSGGYVLKVTRDDEAYHKFYLISLQNQNNPIFPKFVSDVFREWKAPNGQIIRSYGIEKLIVNVTENVKYLQSIFVGGQNKALWDIYGLQMIMEQFWETGPDSEEFIAISHNMNESDRDNLIKLSEIIDDNLGINNKIILDTHKENFGFRPNKELVIFDPVSSIDSSPL